MSVLSIYNPFKAEFATLVKATIGPVVIWTDTQLTRDNFLDRIKAKQITLPACVLAFGDTEEDRDWAVDCDSKRLPTTLFYADAISDGAGDIGDAVRLKLETLKHAIMYGQLTTAAVTEWPEVSTAQINPLNTEFAEDGFSFFAGFLYFRPLFSFPYESWR